MLEYERRGRPWERRESAIVEQQRCTAAWWTGSKAICTKPALFTGEPASRGSQDP